MSDEKEKDLKKLNMADRRKQIERLYDGSDDSLRRIFDKAAGQTIGNRYNEDFLKRIFQSVGSEGLDREQVIDLANFAYSTEPNFAAVIDYFANMYMWRYYYVPIKMRKNADEADYESIYQLMTEIVDGMAIEVTFPMILTKLFKEGEVYLYTVRNRPSKTVSTIILNSEFCRPVMTSQYGTGIFQFNLKYFDDLALYGSELEEVLELFPSEIVEAYLEYKNRKRPNEFIILDGRYSTYLSANDYGFPTSLSVLKSLFDYDQYRKNEVERNGAQLDTIITHKIPSYENRLLFELTEVRALHKSMSRVLGQNKRTRLMTTFGDVELHPMQEQTKISNEVLRSAHEAIYRSAGLNDLMFNGKIKESLETSLNRDKAIVWKYIQQLVNFYNLTINHLYSFRGYQIELTMLPVTHYNLREMMELHRRNGEFGIGRLEAIVASGTKQKHILHKGKLEEFLKLDEILKPLASSHTQSGKIEEEVEEVEEEIEEEITEPEIIPEEERDSD
jgi:hypothetical protein